MISRPSASPNLLPQRGSLSSFRPSPVLLSNGFQNQSPKLSPRHSRGHSPILSSGQAYGDWFPSLGPPVIQEETSQDEFMGEVVGAPGYNTANR